MSVSGCIDLLSKSRYGADLCIRTLSRASVERYLYTCSGITMASTQDEIRIELFADSISHNASCGVSQMSLRELRNDQYSS